MIIITHISWGRLEVKIDDTVMTFKDCKIFPEGAIEWDWNKSGTHHIPGIQPIDIADILEHTIEIMVLTRGMELRLHVCRETELLLCSKGIEYYFEETRQAVAHFNQLAKQGRRVGGIFHSTC